MTRKRGRHEAGEGDFAGLEAEENTPPENEYERQRNARIASNMARMQPALDAARQL